MESVVGKCEVGCPTTRVSEVPEDAEPAFERTSEPYLRVRSQSDFASPTDYFQVRPVRIDDPTLFGRPRTLGYKSQSSNKEMNDDQAEDEEALNTSLSDNTCTKQLRGFWVELWQILCLVTGGIQWGWRSAPLYSPYLCTKISAEDPFNKTEADQIDMPLIEKLKRLGYEIVAGIVVGFTQIPEGLAFSILANMPPATGLHSCWIVGLIGTIFGGRPGVISGLSGTLAATVKEYVELKCENGLCQSEGVETYLIATLIGAFALMCSSLLRFSSLVQLVPRSVFIGYSNGLAIVFWKSQLHAFQKPGTKEYFDGWTLWIMISIFLVSFSVMTLAPHIPKIGPYMPSAILALGMSALLEFGFIRSLTEYHTPTVADTTRFTAADLNPLFVSGNYDFSKVKWDISLLQQSVVLGITSLVSILMTVETINDLHENRGITDQQIFAVGAGNSVSALLGAMGGDCMLGLSVLNYRSGGRGKESGVVTSICTLLVVFYMSKVLSYFPMAGLAGVMAVVGVHMFKWFSIPIVIASCLPERLRSRHSFLKRKIARWDALVIVVVTVVMVLFNLVWAVAVGVLIAGAAFAWKCNSKFMVEHAYDASSQTKYYEIRGILFYGSKLTFESVFEPVSDPPNVVVVLRGKGSYLSDYSSLEALSNVHHRYQKLGKNFRIQGLSTSCAKMCFKANRLVRVVEGDVQDVHITELRRPYIRPDEICDE